MKHSPVPFLLLVVLGVNAEGLHHDLECNDQASAVCLSKGYSTFDFPLRTKPNLIKIGFEISDVLGINDKDYSITFGLYFSAEWLEPRLNLSNELWEEGDVATETDLVPVNLELIKSLWIPNIFIYNLKTFQTIEVLSKLAGLWIDARKRIYYSQATHITFICPMLFDAFPLDTQICKFQVGSYSYDKSRMMFDVSTLGYIQKTQSIILDYDITIRNLKRKDKIFDAGALGNFSLAGFEMTLKRHFLSYIITYYLPSGLFVAVSWISFLIPPDIVPGRMALLITLFLVLVNIFNNVTTNSPKAEGLTAIEIWMLACILFVFGALIEYAVILNQKQKAAHPRKKKESERKKFEQQEIIKIRNGSISKDTNAREDAAVLLSCNQDQSGGPLAHCQANAEKRIVKNITSCNYQYAKVDRFFLYFSPFLFLIFNAIYWGYFLRWDKFICAELDIDQ